MITDRRGRATPRREIGNAARRARSILQITILAYAFDRLVSQEKRSGASAQLDAFETRASRNNEWYSGVPLLGSPFELLAKAFDGWIR